MDSSTSGGDSEGVRKKYSMKFGQVRAQAEEGVRGNSYTRGDFVASKISQRLACPRG